MTGSDIQIRTGFCVVGVVMALCSPLQASTYDVTNRGDSGPGSLRDAINFVNGNCDASNQINFNIPLWQMNNGRMFIDLYSPLPDLTCANTVVDGYSQENAQPGNYRSGWAQTTIGGTTVGTGPDGIGGNGDDPVIPVFSSPIIDLRWNTSTNQWGTKLSILAPKVTVKGLSILGQVYVSGSACGTVIKNNVIGGDPSDSGLDPHSWGAFAEYGVLLGDTSTPCSGYANAIQIDNNEINWTHMDGITATSPGSGSTNSVKYVTVTNNLILNAGAGSTRGVSDYSDAITAGPDSHWTDSTFSRNYIKDPCSTGMDLNAGEKLDMPTTYQVQDNTVTRNSSAPQRCPASGTTAGENYGIRIISGGGDVVSQNNIRNMQDTGITIWGSSATQAASNNIETITKNDLEQNSYGGLSFVAASSAFGGGALNTFNAVASQNLIQQNGQFGIAAYAMTNSGTTFEGGVEFSQNSTLNNTGLGIDLLQQSYWDRKSAPEGVTPNSGIFASHTPNELTNYPIFTAAVLDGGVLHVQGYVGSVPGQSTFGGANVEVFSSDAEIVPDNGAVVSGDGLNLQHGEGEHFLGSCIADAFGNFDCSFAVDPALAISKITGTGTTQKSAIQYGKTSEFGPKFELQNVVGLPRALRPSVSKSYTSSPIAVGNTAYLEFTFTNPQGAGIQSGLGLTDDLTKQFLSAGLKITGSTSTGCQAPGVASAPQVSVNAQGNVVTLSNISIAAAFSAPQICVVRLTVAGLLPGSYSNSVAGGNITGITNSLLDTQGLNSTLVVTAANLSLAKTFLVSALPANTVSTLKITLTNPNAVVATLNADLVDNLPVTLQVANPPQASTTCIGGSVIAPAGSSSVRLSSGAGVPANGQCEITVNVISSVPGVYTNVLPANALSTQVGNNTQETSAILTVWPQPSVSQSFGPATVTVGQPSQLTITLTNGAPQVATLSQALIDTLPAGLVIVPNTISTSCPNGNVSASGSTLTLAAGAQIPASGSCVVKVQVKADKQGRFVSQTPANALQTLLGPNPFGAEAKLVVVSAVQDIPALQPFMLLALAMLLVGSAFYAHGGAAYRVASLKK